MLTVSSSRRTHVGSFPARSEACWSWARQHLKHQCSHGGVKSRLGYREYSLVWTQGPGRAFILLQLFLLSYSGSLPHLQVSPEEKIINTFHHLESLTGSVLRNPTEDRWAQGSDTMARSHGGGRPSDTSHPTVTEGPGSLGSLPSLSLCPQSFLIPLIRNKGNFSRGLRSWEWLCSKSLFPKGLSSPLWGSTS